MISRLPLKPIYLAFLLVLLYYVIFSGAIAALLLLMLALIGLMVQYDKRRVGQTLCFLAAFGLFFTYQQSKINKNYAQAPANLSQLQLLPDSLSVNGDSLSFRATSGGQTYQAFYKLKSQAEQRYFQELDQTLVLTVEATTEEATPQRNFGGFDYRRYLKNEGIYRTAHVAVISKASPKSRLNMLEYLRELRRKAIVHSQEHFPAPMRHYMTGLLFGYLPKEFAEMSDLYTSLGIIHLFALSGMHVSFFLKLFRFVFLRMGWRLDVVNWLQLPFSIFYAGATGFSVSVLRSLTQANLASLGLRKLDNLALTLMFLFVIKPTVLLTTGGVLSFTYAFVLALIDFSEVLAGRKVLAESLSLSLGVLPVLMRFFATFQPLSILLTAGLSLVFDKLILPLLTAAFLLSPVLKLTGVNLLFQLLEKVIIVTGQLLGRPLILGMPSLPILLCLLLLLGVLYDHFRRKKLALVLSLLVALLFFLVKHPLQNEVTVVDVGQGDSILLRDWKGKTVLIDVGGRVSFETKEGWQSRSSDSNAERTLVPYLKSRGISRIDQLVLTHTDADHMGDMAVVAEHFQIGQVLVSSGSLNKASFAAQLQAMKVKVRTVQAGDRLNIMESQLQVLYPNKVGDGGNNDSIVLYGKLLDKTFLFTGDLEDVEKELMATYPQLPVDVLKAGHHGSKGSSDPAFLAHIGAKLALVSAGENNRYQHPHQETLDRFAKEKMTVYRTDQQGAIRFTGWRKWHIETVR